MLKSCKQGERQMPQQEGGQRTKKAIHRRNTHGNKEIKSVSPWSKKSKFMQPWDTTRGVSDWQRLKRMVRPGRQGQGKQKLS